MVRVTTFLETWICQGIRLRSRESWEKRPKVGGKNQGFCSVREIDCSSSTKQPTWWCSRGIWINKCAFVQHSAWNFVWKSWDFYVWRVVWLHKRWRVNLNKIKCFCVLLLSGRVRLNTTQCWRRQVFITIPATTLNSARRAESISAWQHSASQTQVCLNRLMIFLLINKSSKSVIFKSGLSNRSHYNVH